MPRSAADVDVNVEQQYCIIAGGRREGDKDADAGEAGDERRTGQEEGGKGKRKLGLIIMSLFISVSLCLSGVLLALWV